MKTIVAFASSFAMRSATTHAPPAEIPAKMPSSAASRRAIAQRAGDRDDALIVERHEVAARLRAPPLRIPGEHGVVRERRRYVVGAAQPREIRDGLDVENEDRRHRRYAGKTPVER